MKKKLLNPTSASNPIVFMDINFGQERAGRLIIELRKDVVPKTAENFRALCTGERGIGQLGKPLHYKGVRFHRVTRVFVAQSGDVVNNDGTSGESIYGPQFEDENFTLSHEDGVVSMANYGKPNSNNSQFVITSVACENLNGSNVVVGKVLRGLGIIGDMELNATDDGEPTTEIYISNCGELLPGHDWNLAVNDETEDILPPYPGDWERKFDSFTSDEIVTILTSIRNAGNYYFSKQRYLEARSKYRKANRYYTMFRERFSWQELQHMNYNEQDLAKLDSFSVINNINTASAEMKLEEFESAKYVCSEAIRLDPGCSKAFYRRGQAQIVLKNYEEAIKDFKQSHDLMPDNKQILNELERARRLLRIYNHQQMSALRTLFNKN